MMPESLAPLCPVPVDGLVSVVIPSYNRAYCVAATIDSVLAQTYPQVEVLLVDDGSTDGTRELIASRFGHDSRVRYLPQPNQGVSAARNTGFRHARGEFVALLDSDDLWFPEKLAAQIALFRAHPEIGMVWSDMEAIDMQGRVLSTRYLRQMYSAWSYFRDDELFATRARLGDLDSEATGSLADAPVHTGTVYSQMIMGSLVHTSAVVLRRERQRAVGGFNGRYRNLGEDYDFHLRTCQAGPVGFIDLPLIKYRRGNPDRLTRPEHHFDAATNFLKVIEPHIRDNRAAILLPDQMLNEVMAEAHFWIADVAWDLGDMRIARTQLAAGLVHRPYAPKYRVKYLLASLPAFACRTVVGLLHALKGWRRELAAG
jgi:GT2 family glycosyltransferase